MAIRSFPGNPVRAASAIGQAVSTASTGPKRTYTCPAGFGAILRFMSVVTIAGAATVQLRVTLGGIVAALAMTTTQASVAPNISLDAGDTATIHVTVLDAAGTADMCIAVEEFPVV